MTGLLLLAGLSLTLAQQPDSPTSPPETPATAPVSLSSLPQGKKDAVMMGYLGLSPVVLAASGYSAPDAVTILAKARQRDVLGVLQSELNTTHTTGDAEAQSTGSGSQPAGTPPPSPFHLEPPSASSQRATKLRQSVLALAFPGDAGNRAAKVERCLAGIAIGLPADMAMACTSDSERSHASAALLAEQRAIRLNRPVPQSHADLLARLRARPEATAAAQGLSANTAAIGQSVQGQGSASGTE